MPTNTEKVCFPGYLGSPVSGPSGPGLTHFGSPRPAKYLIPTGSRHLPTVEFRKLHCLVLTLRAAMRRRDFIVRLGGTAATWPLAARAQQTRQMRRIAVLMVLGADDPEGQARVAASAQGLQQLGWTVGQNVQIDYRWASVNAEELRKDAAELVGLKPDVILAHSSSGVASLLQATHTVPIVFTNVADPVGAG